MTKVVQSPNEAATALVQQGYELRQQGDVAGALDLYRQAAAMPNAPMAAHFNLGNGLYAKSDWAGAKTSFTNALAQLAEMPPSPEMYAAMLQVARCDFRLGQYREARANYVAVLKAEPENYSAWQEIGHVCRELGETDRMLAAYRKAAEVAPQRWDAMLALVRAQEEAGQWDAASYAYQRAVTLAGSQKADSPYSEAKAKTTAGYNPIPLSQLHAQVARFRLERGDAPRALEAMRQALMAVRLEHDKREISIDERAEMQITLGNILMRLGMSNEAHRAFERASVATSESTLVRLAELSFRFNLWEEAVAVLKRNVDLHPDSALAHWNLAHAYVESWQLEEALEALAKAEAIAPQQGARSMRASVAGRTGDAETALRIYRELAAEDVPQSGMHSSAAMSSLYSDQLSAQEVADMHRELFAALGTGARPALSLAKDLDPNKRVKVGLITADFHHQHPVNIFMQPVLARLDATQFEVCVYFTGISHDEQTIQARQRSHLWVECANWNDEQLARRIEADGIDVLIDLSGHTSRNRMAMFAKRAAPVQMTFLGYPASTGLPNMDWILADGVVAPEGSESLYTERIWRLPNTVFCFSPEVAYPFPVYDQTHAERPLTFGSFNNVPKLTQHTLKLWAEVLQAVPDSRLLLKAPSFKDAGAVNAFKRRFEALDVDASRVEFRGPVGLTDMMAEYADVDIALDPVPYNGGTTTLQAMWMGVPVVVKAGNNFVSRMGASFMQAAGLGEWVAQSDAEYVAIAAKMASDRQALLALKQGMRERQISAAAWDIDAYTRDFEKALRGVWVDFCKTAKA